MVQKLGELSNFLVFSSRIESFGNSSVLLFLTTVCLIPVSVFIVFQSDAIWVSNAFMDVFSDEQEPPPTSPEDGRLCSMGQHHPGFP
jgi:hypothetical protein